jgi:hypothetical protein
MGSARIATVLAVLAALVGLTACSSPAHPAGRATPSTAATAEASAQLTVAQASAVFSAFLPKFSQLSSDPSLASQLTAGPLASSESFLKGTVGPSVGTLSGEHFLVPYLTGFPRWFLADGTASNGQGFLFVMLQQTTGAPWRATAEFFDQSSAGQILPDLDQAGLGRSEQYSPVIAADAGLQPEPSRLAAAYARYLDQPGSASSPQFTAGTYTSLRARSNQQTARKAETLGWQLTDTMTTVKQPLYGLSLPTGAGALVIFFTAERYTWTARSAAAVIKRDSASLATPPDVFLTELGIHAAAAGLRVTLKAIDQALAFVGPPGTKPVIVTNNGAAISLAKN